MRYPVKKALLCVAFLISSMPVHGQSYLANQLTLSGVLEIDAYSLDQDAGSDEFDIIVSSLEIGLDVEISDRLGVSTLLLYEDGFSGLKVDTAIITVALRHGFDLAAGQMTLPFGRYETAALSDPMTLELGETTDSAIRLGVKHGVISGSLTLFNGNNEEISSSQNDDEPRMLLALDYEADTIKAGFSWVSNLDSDVLEELATTTQASNIPALGMYFTWSNESLSLSVEHISALENYTAGDFGGDVTLSGQPAATAAGISIAIGVDATLSLSVQHSTEAAFVGLHEDSIFVGYSRRLESDLEVGLELGDSQDYDPANGGNDNDASHILFRMSAGF